MNDNNFGLLARFTTMFGKGIGSVEYLMAQMGKAWLTMKLSEKHVLRLRKSSFQLSPQLCHVRGRRFLIAGGV